MARGARWARRLAVRGRRVRDPRPVGATLCRVVCLELHGLRS